MEVTISLSNPSQKNIDLGEKVIKLKPIPQKNQTSLPSFSEKDELHIVEEEIARAKNELKRLEQKQQEKISQTEQAIQKEKNNWKVEKQKLIKEAKKYGYKEGFQKGETEALQQYEEKIFEANELIKRAQQDYQATVTQSKDSIIDLSLAIAEKIIHKQISIDPTTFQSIVEAALKTIECNDDIAIYVHPSQFDFIINQKEELRNYVNGQVNLQIYMDYHLTETSCIIEHPFGQVDASVDTQLQEIRSVLENIRTGEN